jgi:hypothetical protein
MLKFTFPTRDRLDNKLGGEMNMSEYFATGRYNRLCIQQCLVRSAFDDSLYRKIEEFETQHNKDFSLTLDLLSKYNYKDEFLFAVKEEHEALQKIIEAYDKRFKMREY